MAALRLGRRAICMELDEQWVKRAAKEIAEARLDAEYQPPKRVQPMAREIALAIRKII